MYIDYDTLMNDITFKESFADPHNRKQLESLLENLLELPKGSLKNKLSVSYESLIHKNNIHEKNSRTDISVEFDDMLVDLEAYSYLDKESVYKSTFYVMKISASKLMRGSEYDLLKVVQYNFVDHVHTDIGPDVMNTFCLVHNKYPNIKIAEELFQINYIRIDKIRELGYNENELMKWLRFIAARNYEERKNIAEGDEMFMEFNEWIDHYVNDDLTRKAMAEWNEKIMTNKQIKIAHEQGIEEGIKEGIKEGTKQRNLEIAKKLLKMNLAIEDIEKATDLSKEEIIQLEKEIR